MATSDSKEVVIEASPEVILDVIADVVGASKYSSAQESVEVVSTYDDGRPREVKMKVKSAGITDDLVIEYTWDGNVVSWTLVSSKAQKAQDAKYTLTPQGDKTKVKFELTVDLTVPLPGFLLKKALKGAMSDATDGLRKRVLAK